MFANRASVVWRDTGEQANNDELRAARIERGPAASRRSFGWLSSIHYGSALGRISRNVAVRNYLLCMLLWNGAADGVWLSRGACAFSLKKARRHCAHGRAPAWLAGARENSKHQAGGGMDLNHSSSRRHQKHYNTIRHCRAVTLRDWLRWFGSSRLVAKRLRLLMQV